MKKGKKTLFSCGNCDTAEASKTNIAIKLLKMSESHDLRLVAPWASSTETQITELSNKKSNNTSLDNNSSGKTTASNTNTNNNNNQKKVLNMEVPEVDETSVSYDNKADLLKNIMLAQKELERNQEEVDNEEDEDRHHRVVNETTTKSGINPNMVTGKKGSGKMKSLFRTKKSSKTLRNYSFTSIRSRSEAMNTIDINNNISNNKKCDVHYVVEIRVVFYKVGEIDTLNEKFYAEAFIEASWIDPYLDQNRSYNPKEHWNPDILISNSIGVIKEERWYSQEPFKENNSRIVIHQSKSDMTKNDCVCTKMYDLDESKHKAGCMVIERRRVNGMFWQLLNLKDFPSDVQNLTLSISTSKHSNEITLLHSREKYSSVNVNCFLDHQEWHLYKHVKVKEFLRESVFSSETFPSIDLTICVARRPTFYYLNAFFLIFLITFSSLTIFSVSCNLPQNRLQLGCTLLLTSVTFKWVTNRSLPTVSYMTSLDKYSLGCIIIICLQCIWHGSVGFLTHYTTPDSMLTQSRCIEPFAKFDFLAFLVACALLLLFNFSFLILFIRIGFCKRRGLNRLETDYINNLVGKRVTRLKSMLHGA